MRRIDKELFKKIKTANLMDVYNRLTQYTPEEVEEMWRACPWPRSKKARTICETVLVMAYDTAAGRKKVKKDAPNHHERSVKGII